MVGALFLVLVTILVLGCLLPRALATGRLGPTTRQPKPIQAAIAELTAHKLQHQSWMEGQRLAATWWEEQCACPQVKDYRQIPGCARISNGVCVSFETQAEAARLGVDVGEPKSDYYYEWLKGRMSNPLSPSSSRTPPIDPRYMAKRMNGRSHYDPLFQVRP